MPIVPESMYGVVGWWVLDLQCAKCSRSSSRAQMGATRNSSSRAQVVRNDGKEEEENNLVCVGPFGAFVAVAVPGSNLFPVLHTYTTTW